MTLRRSLARDVQVLELDQDLTPPQDGRAAPDLFDACTPNAMIRLLPTVLHNLSRTSRPSQTQEIVSSFLRYWKNLADNLTDSRHPFADPFKTTYKYLSAAAAGEAISPDYPHNLYPHSQPTITTDTGLIVVLYPLGPWVTAPYQDVAETSIQSVLPIPLQTPDMAGLLRSRSQTGKLTNISPVLLTEPLLGWEGGKALISASILLAYCHQLTSNDHSSKPTIHAVQAEITEYSSPLESIMQISWAAASSLIAR